MRLHFIFFLRTCILIYVSSNDATVTSQYKFNMVCSLILWVYLYDCIKIQTLTLSRVLHASMISHV